jgi:hypothetical protein
MSFVYGFFSGAIVALLSVYLFVRFLVDDLGAFTFRSDRHPDETRRTVAQKEPVIAAVRLK